MALSEGIWTIKSVIRDSRECCLLDLYLAIRLDAVLQAVELPAGVANLTAGLPDVDADALTLKYFHILTSDENNTKMS